MKSKMILLTKDMIQELVIKGLEADYVLTDLQKDEIGRALEQSIRDEWIVNMRLDMKHE